MFSMFSNTKNNNIKAFSNLKNKNMGIKIQGNDCLYYYLDNLIEDSVMDVYINGFERISRTPIAMKTFSVSKNYIYGALSDISRYPNCIYTSRFLK